MCDAVMKQIRREYCWTLNDRKKRLWIKQQRLSQYVISRAEWWGREAPVCHRRLSGGAVYEKKLKLCIWLSWFWTSNLYSVRSILSNPCPSAKNALFNALFTVFSTTWVFAVLTVLKGCSTHYSQADTLSTPDVSDSRRIAGLVNHERIECCR